MNPEQIKSFVRECKDAHMLTDLIAIACAQPAIKNLGCEKLLPEGPSGNIYFRQMDLSRVGHRVPGERHNYDHVFIVFAGEAIVREGHKERRLVELPERPGTRIIIEGAMRREESCILPAETVEIEDWVGPVQELAYGPGSWKLIRAGLWHETVSNKPGTIAACIFAHRDEHGEITQTGCGFQKPYV
jgi:hypothetical protein